MWSALLGQSCTACKLAISATWLTVWGPHERNAWFCPNSCQLSTRSFANFTPSICLPPGQSLIFMCYCYFCVTFKISINQLIQRRKRVIGASMPLTIGECGFRHNIVFINSHYVIMFSLVFCSSDNVVIRRRRRLSLRKRKYLPEVTLVSTR